MGFDYKISRIKILDFFYVSLFIVVFLQYSLPAFSSLGFGNILYIKLRDLINYLTPLSLIILFYNLIILQQKKLTLSTPLLFFTLSIGFISSYSDGFTDFKFFSSLFTAVILYKAYYCKNDSLTTAIYIATFLLLFLFIYMLFTNNLFGLQFIVIGQQNYISSIFFSLLIGSIFFTNKISIPIFIATMAVLLIFRSRTSLLCLFILFFAANYKKKSYWLIITLFIIFSYYSGIFGTVVNKWESASITSGRFAPWAYYSMSIIDNLPNTLFPSFLYTDSHIFNDFYHDGTGRNVSPHNFFIEFSLRSGLIISVPIIFIILAPLFSKKNVYPKYFKPCLISLMAYSFFEPSVSFNATLISTVFFSVIISMFGIIKGTK